MYDELVKTLRLRAALWEKMYDEDIVLKQAADAIEKLSKPRWIPVTERLPEEGVSVQVCFHSQGGKAQAVSERFLDNRNQSYWSGLCWMNPTHWMPLPEPPKEE